MITDKIENVKVSSVFVGREDHGILTAFVNVAGDGWAQSFGGYDLRRGSACSAFVSGLLDVFEVDDLSKIEGKTCRIASRGGSIVAIGNIIKDKWFSRDEVFLRSISVSFRRRV